MKIAWLSDLHLNFVGRIEIDKLCESIRLSGAGIVLITGDIATAENLCRYLDYLSDVIRKRIFFVLGNHDYYHSAIAKVNQEVAAATDGHLFLTWLSRHGVMNSLQMLVSSAMKASPTAAWVILMALRWTSMITH